MPLMDEFREERENVKSQPFKKKAAYFWEYYKWYVLGSLLALFLLFTLIRDIVRQKDYALFCIVVNGYVIGEEEELGRDFCDYAGIDKKEYTVGFNSSLHLSDGVAAGGLDARQFIIVHLAGGDLDVGLMDAAGFDEYAYQNAFTDLREILSAELYEKLVSEGRVCYADRACIEKMTAMRNSGDFEGLESFACPDSTDPSKMDEAVPVGIRINGIEKLESVYYFNEQDFYLGVFINAPNRDNCVRFIAYLFEQ